MAITRANVEAILVKRCGALLTAAGLAVTYAGANADLNDPIGYAIRKLGGSVANIAAVADADIATLSSDDTDALLDVAELRTIENIQGNLAAVDLSVGPRSESFSQLGVKLEKRIKQLQDKIEKEYGIGAVEAETGVYSFDFAYHNDTLVSE